MKVKSVLFLAMIIISCTNEKMESYKNLLYNVDYPKSWKINEIDNALLILSPKENEKDIFHENVNIIVQDIGNRSLTLESYIDFSKNEIIQAFGKSSVVSLDNISFSGIKAKEFVYYMPKNSSQNRTFDLKIKQIVFIENEKVFLLTYTSEKKEYGNYLEMADYIFNSFSLN